MTHHIIHTFCDVDDQHHHVDDADPPNDGPDEGSMARAVHQGELELVVWEVCQAGWQRAHLACGGGRTQKRTLDPVLIPLDETHFQPPYGTGTRQQPQHACTLPCWLCTENAEKPRSRVMPRAWL